MNFPFDCNRIGVVYLLTCKVCPKQHAGSTLTKYRLRFNQYQSNIKLYRESKSGFKQACCFGHTLHVSKYTTLRYHRLLLSLVIKKQEKIFGFTI